MARKFIIHENEFIMGNVGYHFELKPNGTKTRPEGGGYWHINPKLNIFFLYGSSSDFGALTRERILEVISSTNLGTRLDGYEVYHSYSVEFPGDEPEHWTHIHTVDKDMTPQPDAFTEDEYLEYKMHPGAKAMMEEMTRNQKNRVPVRTKPKIQRNEPCPCGSGKKYKKCCL